MTMHVMERDYGEIVAARLAEMLDVTPATVAMTFKRMERDSWITGNGAQVGSASPIPGVGSAFGHPPSHAHRVAFVEDPQGAALASSTSRLTASSMPSRQPWKSDMRDVLGDPQVCPHGNPLPGCEHVVNGWVPLPALRR